MSIAIGSTSKGTIIVDSTGTKRIEEPIPIGSTKTGTIVVQPSTGEKRVVTPSGSVPYSSGGGHWGGEPGWTPQTPVASSISGGTITLQQAQSMSNQPQLPATVPKYNFIPLPTYSPEMQRQKAIQEQQQQVSISEIFRRKKAEATPSPIFGHIGKLSSETPSIGGQTETTHTTNVVGGVVRGVGGLASTLLPGLRRTPEEYDVARELMGLEKMPRTKEDIEKSRVESVVGKEFTKQQLMPGDTPEASGWKQVGETRNGTLWSKQIGDKIVTASSDQLAFIKQEVSDEDLRAERARIGLFGKGTIGYAAGSLSGMVSGGAEKVGALIPGPIGQFTGAALGTGANILGIGIAGPAALPLVVGGTASNIGYMVERSNVLNDPLSGMGNIWRGVSKGAEVLVTTPKGLGTLAGFVVGTAAVGAIQKTEQPTRQIEQSETQIMQQGEKEVRGRFLGRAEAKTEDILVQAKVKGTTYSERTPTTYKSEIVPGVVVEGQGDIGSEWSTGIAKVDAKGPGVYGTTKEFSKVFKLDQEGVSLPFGPDEFVGAGKSVLTEINPKFEAQGVSSATESMSLINRLMKYQVGEREGSIFNTRGFVVKGGSATTPWISGEHDVFKVTPSSPSSTTPGGILEIGGSGGGGLGGGSGSGFTGSILRSVSDNIGSFFGRAPLKTTASPGTVILPQASQQVAPSMFMMDSGQMAANIAQSTAHGMQSTVAMQQTGIATSGGFISLPGVESGRRASITRVSEPTGGGTTKVPSVLRPVSPSSSFDKLFRPSSALEGPVTFFASKGEVKTGQILGTSTILMQGQNQNQGQPPGILDRIFPQSEDTSKRRQEQPSGQVPLMSGGQILQQQQIQSTTLIDQPWMPPSVPFSYPEPSPPTPGGGGIPSPLSGGFFNFGGRGRGAKRVRDYLPSLGSKMFGVFAPKEPKASTRAGWSGLEFRPIITGPLPVFKQSVRRTEKREMKKSKKVLGPLDYLGRRK